MDKLTCLLTVLLCLYISYTAPTSSEDPQLNSTRASEDLNEFDFIEETTEEVPEILLFSEKFIEIHAKLTNSSTNTTSTTKPPDEDVGAEILQTPWLGLSDVLFRKVHKLPSPALSLYNVKCDYPTWVQHSPVYSMAFPLHGKNDTKNKDETVTRNDMFQIFRKEPVGTMKLSKELNELWETINKTEEGQAAEKIKIGRSLEAAICYSDGYELLECDAASSKCVCPSSGTLKKLRMLRMKKSKESNISACYAMDCGYCLMKSKTTCGHYGTCREAAVTREWPFTHLNGSCRNSVLMLNSQPAGHGDSYLKKAYSPYIMILVLFTAMFYKTVNSLDSRSS